VGYAVVAASGAATAQTLADGEPAAGSVAAGATALYLFQATLDPAAGEPAVTFTLTPTGKAR
jgi:hypothetical protein